MRGRRTVGLTVMPQPAKSMPLGAVKAGAVKPQEDLVEEARVTVHVHTGHRHRHRHRHRSRRRGHRHWR
jgi:hypothetical protein